MGGGVNVLFDGGKRDLKSFQHISACASDWQVLTSVAVNAISSLPFGAPVGALLGAVFSRAAQVWT